MNAIKSTFFCLVAALLTSTAAQPASATTIPAGTSLVIKTGVAISSREPTGRRFPVQLARQVNLGGGTLLPAGTKATAIVKSPSFTVGSTTRPLTLRLVEIVVHGRAVSINTEDLKADNTSPWAAGPRRIQVTGAAFLVPAGSVFQFRLKTPVEI